jgi:hypothetical protein
MNAIHPALAAALAPFAPPSSVVHRIVEATPEVRCNYSDMKNSGELERRRIEKAIRNERPHPWEITL